MLKSIEYTVQFTSTGRTLHEKIKFQRGFGAITGPNEAGKSMVIEMVRWLLFGSAALRGSAADYKKIHGALEFIVRGEEYFLTRASNGATLYRGKAREEIAVGTKPVNAKVIEIFGYGLAVFDISNAANQNALLALGQMRATERKRLVDSVIGLGVIEDMGKLAGDEANSLRRRYEDLSSSVREPMCPVEPPFYRPSKEVKEVLTSYQKSKSELDQLNGWLSVEYREPQQPKEPTPLDSIALQEMVDTQNALRLREKELSSLPKPRYTLEEIEAMQNQNIGFENQKRVKALKERVVHLEKDHITCPECNHSWSLDARTIEQIKTEIESLTLFSDKPSELPDMFLDRELKKLKTYNADHDAELAQIKKTLEKQPDFRTMLIERQRYEIAVGNYAAELEAYQNWASAYEGKKEQVKMLEFVVSEMPRVQEEYEVAREYESHKEFYSKVKQEYDEIMATVAQVRENSEDWQKARVALVALRTKVKQHLVPSLNRVASHLLKEMTNGQRQVVVIDEDFEITVDGQPLNTLSGSGMAVANLAIRLGLGQVLTNNVFSVFMADEIDASMDQNRAESTVNSLKNLRTTISQMLLVTHKSPTADYHIVLGENNE